MSYERSRSGCELLAAAMTMGDSFAIRTDHQVGRGDGIDLSGVLESWGNAAEQEELLRRAIFAPETYGGIRFHHRSAQEFLTASWLRRLLERDGGAKLVSSILFVEAFGVSVVSRALRPAAAWLAHWDSTIRSELIRRDPYVLVQFGDPAALPVSTRESILTGIATAYEYGGVCSDPLDDRSLKLFADPRLGNCIKKIWRSSNSRAFRIVLVQLIRMARMGDCVGLLLELYFDPASKEIEQLKALHALVAIDDAKGLNRIAEELQSHPGQCDNDQALAVADLLFPKYLNVDGLIKIIDADGVRRRRRRGVGSYLRGFWRACENSDQALELLEKLVSLCEKPPLSKDFRSISEKHLSLARHLAIFVRLQLARSPIEAPPGIIQALRLVQIAGSEFDYVPDGEASLEEQIRKRPPLQRLLFWGTHEDSRRKGVYIKRRLYQLGQGDLPWLYDDLKNRTLLSDRKECLDHIVRIHKSCDQSDFHRLTLAEAIQDSPELQISLTNALALGEADFDSRAEVPENEEPNKASQDTEDIVVDVQLKTWLKGKLDPGKVLEPEVLSALNYLSSELKSSDSGTPSVAHHWSNLETKFGKEIAEKYRDCLRALWRKYPVRQPLESYSGASWIWQHVLCMAGVTIDAELEFGGSPELSEDEISLLITHACHYHSDLPEWLSDLVVSGHAIAKKEMLSTLEREWDGPLRLVFLTKVVKSPELLRALEPEVFRLFSRVRSDNPQQLRSCLTKLIKQWSGSKERTALIESFAEHGIKTAQFEHTDPLLCYLSLILDVDSERGVEALKLWLESGPPEKRNQMADQAFARLFGSDKPWALESLTSAPTREILNLVRLSQRYPQASLDSEDPPGMNYQQNFAPLHSRDGREAIFQVLVDRGGEESYHAIKTLAEECSDSDRQHLLRVARGVAERKASWTNWTAEMFLQAHRGAMLPVQSAKDFFSIVIDVLEEIDYTLALGDFTLRSLLLKAELEFEVQNWLAHELNLRKRGRYHVHRESEIADSDKPDLFVSSGLGEGAWEVAIEVKQADNWTFNQLTEGLCEQLAGRYLKPDYRRAGVLFIVRQARAGWEHPDGSDLDFHSLTSALNEMADSIRQRDALAGLKVVGVDVSLPDKLRQRRKGRRKKVSEVSK